MSVTKLHVKLKFQNQKDFNIVSNLARIHTGGDIKKYVNLAVYKYSMDLIKKIEEEAEKQKAAKSKEDSEGTATDRGGSNGKPTSGEPANDNGKAPTSETSDTTILAEQAK